MGNLVTKNTVALGLGWLLLLVLMSTLGEPDELPLTTEVVEACGTLCTERGVWRVTATECICVAVVADWKYVPLL
jgi:hypothetical protein